MPRLVGETVTLITLKGAHPDEDGRPVYPPEVNRPVPGCVIVPVNTEIISARDYTLAGEDISVLAPVFLTDVEDGAKIRVRGEIWEVDRPPIHHRSPFGTGRGGTELPARRVTGT